MQLRPVDPPGTVYEFFAPFAHIPGKYEWCRIRSPTHGVFDTFILLGPSTAQPAHVYVNSAMGQKFMAERFPECVTIRVPPSDLQLSESADGCVVDGLLRAKEGPLQMVQMTLTTSPAAFPREASYGGDGQPVWGSRFTCWGVDLVVDGNANGIVQVQGEKPVPLRGVPCIVTRGSFARIIPRELSSDVTGSGNL